MLAILAILFGLAAAICPGGLTVDSPRRRYPCPKKGGGDGGYFGDYLNVNMEEGDAEDKEDMKKGKMYKKFSEMSKKKLMQMIKKYEKKIAIMKKVLKGKKKEKKN